MTHDIDALAVEATVATLTKAAKQAARQLYASSHDQRQAFLTHLADILRADAEVILAANANDMDAGKAKGMSPALLDRLFLDRKRLNAIADSLSDIGLQADPIGGIVEEWCRPNGLSFQAVRVPIGVIGIIYEARPNVTIDAAALCIKSGNAAVLRPGSESLGTALALHKSIRKALLAAGLPEQAVQCLGTADRAAVGALLRQDSTVDMIIPRGGRSLIERIKSDSRIPVLSHLDGLCHTYIDRAADPVKAFGVVLNAKMRRTGICGATETLLVHKDSLKILPPILKALHQNHCELRGDDRVRELDPTVGIAIEEDWHTEYLAPILSIKTVDSLDEAITHINHYGSHHTDAIITEDTGAAEKFLSHVDSGIVMVNTSTQFADGGEFGFGAEIGIATGKLHARGPVGAKHLTTIQYRVRSEGACRI